MKKAIYPGSFDPVTVGHMDVIRRASAHCDALTVLVMTNIDKKSVFTAEERVGFLKKALEAEGLGRVQVDFYGGLLADYARDTGATAIVKGLRAVSDFEYEFQMALINRHLYPGAETVFFMADERHLYISSSVVRSVGRHGGDISGLISPAILDDVARKLRMETNG